MLREIVVSVGERYRHFGLDSVADAEPDSIDVLRAYADDGRAWVAFMTRAASLASSSSR